MPVNEDAESVKGKIALIDLHDARLESILLKTGGDAIVRFAHVDIFIERSVDHYEVWSYSADLELGGVDRVTIARPFGCKDYVSDGDVLDASGQRVDLAMALDWTKAANVEIVMSTSGTLSLGIARARLTLLKALGHTEDWNGPLR
jgi:hypothetical protein